MKRCLNCGRECDSDFCPDCGQRMDTGRITVSAFSRLTASTMSKVDGGLINTIRRLTFSPLNFIRDYINGHRIGYTNPVLLIITFALIASVINSFLVFCGLESNEHTVEPESTTDPGITALFNWMFENPVTFAIIMAFPAILAAKIAFRKYGISRYNLGEMLTAALYVMALGNLIDIMLIPLAVLDHFINIGLATIADFASLVPMSVISIAGLCRACRIDDTKTRIKAYAKFFLTLLLLTAVIFLLIIGVMILIMVLNHTI